MGCYTHFVMVYLTQSNQNIFLRSCGDLRCLCFATYMCAHIHYPIPLSLLLPRIEGGWNFGEHLPIDVYGQARRRYCGYIIQTGRQGIFVIRNVSSSSSLTPRITNGFAHFLFDVLNVYLNRCTLEPINSYPCHVLLPRVRPRGEEVEGVEVAVAEEGLVGEVMNNY